MTTDPFPMYMLERGLFPLLGVMVLLVFWRMGVFRRGYLEAGPRRRLRLPDSLWWIGMALAVAALFTGGIPGVFGFVILPLLCMDAARAMRTLGVIGPAAVRGVRAGLLVAVPAGLLAFALNTLAINICLALRVQVPMGVGHKLLEKMLEPPIDPTLVLTITLMAVVAAPLIEEIAYRGLAQTLLGDRLRKAWRWGIIFAVATCFCLVHIPSLPNPLPLPGLFVLGVVYGAVYERTGSLWAPIIAHAIFNASNIGLAFWLMG